MATLKAKEIRKMNVADRTKRLKELKLELVKAKANVQKTGGSNAREARKAIARIITINKSTEEELKNK